MVLTKEQRDKLGTNFTTEETDGGILYSGAKDDNQFSSQPVVERETNKTPKGLSEEQREKLGVDASDSRYWTVNPNYEENIANLQNTGDEVTGGEVWDGSLIGDTESAETIAERERQAELAKIASRETIDEDQLRTDTEDKFQSEIDAINRMYAEKMAAAELDAEGRLGSTGAIQARRGLLGSDFGATQKTRIISANQAIFDTIDAQKTNELVGVYKEIEDDIASELLLQEEAIEQGGVDYLAYLTGQDTRRAENINKTIANMINREVEPTEELYIDLASKLGTTVENLKAIYEENKIAYDKTAEIDKLAEEQVGRIARQEEADILQTEAETDKIGVETAETAVGMLPEEKTEIELENELLDLAQKKIDLEQSIKDLSETDTDYDYKKDQLDLELKKLKIDEQILKNEQTGKEGELDYEQRGEIEGELETANDIVELTNDIIENDKLGDVYGLFTGVMPTIWDQKEKDLKIKLDQLTNLLTMGNLGKMSGVLTDTDIKILTGSASTLGDHRQSVEQVEEELQTILDTFTGKIEEAKGKLGETSDDPWADYDFSNLGGEF